MHRAHDERLDREVAIKLVHHRRVATPEALVRMRREAQAMARISDTHVVQVYDAGETDGQVFVAMEIVRGSTLCAWLAESRSVPAVLALFALVGDLKPDNIRVTDQGVPKICDSGGRPSVR